MRSVVYYHNPGATAELLSMIRAELPSQWQLISHYDMPAGDALALCDFILLPDQPLTEEHLGPAGRLQLVQHQGVGYERIDVAACRRRGIPVCLTPEGTSIGVAEHTILLILALYKQLVTAAAGVREGRWMQWELRQNSFELSGKTLGLVGFGRIGREVAQRSLAFGARVLYFDPLVQSPAGLNLARVASLDDLLSQSDIISLHVPMTSENRTLINAQSLQKVKPGAVLINTARGGLVNEVALADALRAGRLAGAGLDVLQKEPPDPANPLLKLQNVLITPHIAAGTRDALQAKTRAAFANMQRRIAGKPLWHVVPELADLFEGVA